MEQSLDTRTITLTKTFCNHLAATTYESLTPAAVRECKRGILDWLGCALAGSPHPEIDITLETLKLNGGRPVATVIGRGLKLGLLEAPIANGQMGHLLDYDDTHMGGVVLHASSPILAALFALAEHLDEVRSAANPVSTPVTGREFMLAYATGVEAGVRVGRTAPGHHDGGWHLTGTLGTIAAGAACAKLLGLTGQQMTYTLAIAATQAAGMQQNRGTMCKSLHAGKAASNGLLAALLASKGFDGTQEIVEGNKGFGRIYSNRCEPEKLVEGLGGPWVIETNGHKPYACGVLLHPLIDAMVEMKKRHPVDPAQIEGIELRVHPLVLSITGVSKPSTGLQSKFSWKHSAAVAYVDGNAGIPQYTDEKAVDSVIVGLRGKVTAVGDAALGKDEAFAVMKVAGRTHDVHVPHASGTAANPMTDEAMQLKFLANAGIMEPVAAQGIAAAIHRFEDEIVGRLVAAASA
ncbi:MAG: MmgE/PrpD family protein [bacterium]|jgi:2-methylcitrate dehydratase PrpD|nr:MmgE/PrpD family protein [Betaproteobacteria bacterium]